MLTCRSGAPANPSLANPRIGVEAIVNEKAATDYRLDWRQVSGES